jgi:hypothetical protein
VKAAARCHSPPTGKAMPMPMIERISAANIQGKVTSIGAKERVVQVPAWALPLLAQAAIVPPQTGKLNQGDVDAKLTSSGMAIADRIRIKSCLRSADLL